MASTVRTGPAPLPWLVVRGWRAFWHELPRSLGAGALTVASGVPFAVAAVFGAPGWLLVAATLPPALGLTGLANFAGGISRFEHGSFRLDPALALVLAAGSAVAGLGLAAGGPVAWLGAAVGAGLLLVGPLALGYGALRGRSGLGALRGGLILCVYRPLWSVTLLALGCLGFFAAAASAGVLAVAIAPLYLCVAVSVVRQLLDEIDAVQGRG